MDMGGNTEALTGQFGHHDDKALVFLAQQGVGGQAHIGEKQLGGIRGVLADFLDLLAAGEALQRGVDQEQ